MKEYPSDALLMLCGAIRNENGAQDWLKKNGFQELAEFWDAYEDVEKSFQWLKNNGFAHFAALRDAMSGNDKAKVWLIQNGYMMLAAFADAAGGNKTAVQFLIKSGEKYWLLVAKEIYEYEKKQNKKGFFNILFNLGNPYR